MDTRLNASRAEERVERSQKRHLTGRRRIWLRRFLILALTIISAYPCGIWIVIISDGYAAGVVLLRLLPFWLAAVLGFWLLVRFLPEPDPKETRIVCIEGLIIVVVIGVLPYLWPFEVVRNLLDWQYLEIYSFWGMDSEFWYPFSVLIMTIPWNYSFLLSAWHLTKIMQAGKQKRKERSLFCWLFHILAGKSLRRRLLVTVCIVVFITAVLFGIGIVIGIFAVYIFNDISGSSAVYVFDNISGSSIVGFGKAAQRIGVAAMTAAAVLLCIMGGILIWIFCGRNSGARQIESLQEMIHKLSKGDYEVENSIPETSLLYQSGEELAKTADVLEESVQKAIAGERTKVELITNVSHDLKTPLTAIIGYGERLAKQDLPEEAREYVDKLNHKAAYLNGIVQDVFELSKAAGGDIPLEICVLDIKRLWEQTIAEFDERCREAGFDIRRNYAGEEFLVETDGMRMHRVFSNLLDNALKYSLAGTRIYLEVREQDGQIISQLTNTASYEMDFTPDEITGRFVRGNKARTGEGSGIGLAIAETFVQACGGSVQIGVDGDQFRVVLRMEQYEAREEVVENRLVQATKN